MFLSAVLKAFQSYLSQLFPVQISGSENALARSLRFTLRFRQVVFLLSSKLLKMGGKPLNLCPHGLDSFLDFRQFLLACGFRLGFRRSQGFLLRFGLLVPMIGSIPGYFPSGKFKFLHLNEESIFSNTPFHRVEFALFIRPRSIAKSIPSGFPIANIMLRSDTPKEKKKGA